MSCTFAAARLVRMPFGKHKGRTLDEVATTDEGLLYLDWLVGSLDAGPLRAVLDVYLRDPSIAKDLARLVAR